jgi:hypothetical protein
MSNLKHCNTDEGSKVNISDVTSAIRKLKTGKSAGLDGLTGEHYKYASDRVAVVLSLLYTACIIHGHLPQELLDSIIMPIVKDKKGDYTDKDNYRPLAITTVSSKILELIVIDKYGDFLHTQSNQFGFKKKHGTDQCVFVLKEIVEYYVSANSPVFICYLDASKAFDRLNHWMLFNTLIHRHVPLLIVRILMYWYVTQTFTVQWGNHLSEPFKVSNGVRQGGILSPYLFNVYMDELSGRLNNCHIGCCLNGVCLNHLFYADDSVLLAPSADGLQKLLNICSEFAKSKDIIYNIKKTKCMIFLPRWLRDLKEHIFYTDGKALSNVTKHEYLGVIICNNFKDDYAIRKEMKGVYARGNMLIKYFRKCSMEVKCQLFKTYCTNFYCASLWKKFNKSTMNSIEVAYKKMFRAFTHVKKGKTYFTMMENNVTTYKALLRNLIFSFRKRLYDSTNVLIKTTVDSLHFLHSKSRRVWDAYLYAR